MIRSSFIRWIGGAVIASLAVCTLAACSLADEPQPAGQVEVGPLPGQESKLAPASLPDLADGAQIFAQHCAGCHGETGKGNGPQSAGITQGGGKLPDFTDPAFANASSPKDWFAIVTSGNMAALMPPWDQTLSDQQRWDVTYYVTTLSQAPGALETGKTAYTANCQQCHGEKGTDKGLNDGAKMAALSNQTIYDQYVVNGTDGVHTFGDKIDEATRWALIGYVRGFSYHTAAQVAAAATPTAAPSPTPTVEQTTAPTQEGATSAPAGSETPGTPAPTATTAPTAAPAGTGNVSGKVSNGTPGGQVPPDTTVKLSGLQLDASNNVNQFINQTATVSADGSYRFDGLPFDKQNAAYVVTVTYNGLQFDNFQRIDPTTPTMDLPITIYEVTTDPAVVKLDAVHYFFTAHQTSLLVVQVMIFSNTSDKAYISSSRLPTGQAASVAFGLPTDANSVSFDSGNLGERFITWDNLIYDTQPLLPGQGSDTVSAQYIVPYNDNSRDFTFPIQYSTTLINVLTPPEMTLSGGSFTKGPDKSFNGQTLSAYTMNNPSAGQPLTFHVSSGMQPIEILKLVLAIILVLLVITGGVYWFMRQRAQAAPIPVLGGEASEALIRQIAALDDAYREGKINRLDYEARRAELKAQAAEQMRGDS